MRPIYTVILFLFATFNAMGQEQKANDITRSFALRLEAGYQKSAYVSAGVSRIVIDASKGFLGSSYCVYSALDVHVRTNTRQQQPYGGFKIGYESAWGGILCGGIEMKGLSDFNYLQPVFTLKAGLSIFNVVNLLYGYSFFDQSNNRFSIGRHQVGLSINYSRKLVKAIHG